MNPSKPIGAGSDPLGWREDLREALAQPLLAVFADCSAAVDGTHRRAAYSVAVCLGKCRLGGVDPCDLDGTLPARMAISALGQWQDYLVQWVAAVEQLPCAWSEAAEEVEALDLAVDLLSARMNSWAVFLAVDEAYEDSVETASEFRTQLREALRFTLDALNGFDEALRRQVVALAPVAGTEFLANWRSMLAAEYRAVLPWWLDGSLEDLWRQVGPGTPGWIPEGRSVAQARFGVVPKASRAADRFGPLPSAIDEPDGRAERRLPLATSRRSSPGRGDPYWYEWFVGVPELVNLVDPDADVLSVAFQQEWVKGWDDVVVRLRNGRRRCYQVKHTRDDDTLTFGDLVGGEDSLLRSLFTGWVASGFNDGLTDCILYTNREPGDTTAQSRSGVERPPLTEFLPWLREAVSSAGSLAEIAPRAEWGPAWAEWRDQLSGEGEAAQLAFLRCLEIRPAQGDLDGLVRTATAALGRAFGVDEQRVGPLLDSLHRALRKWTTGHGPVTAEDLCSELRLAPETRDLAPAPPPPAPFFPTRIPAAEALEQALASASDQPVFFLTAEPGAGKSSAVSWLANRRVESPFAGRVGLRFFCFEPIRPEVPFIAPDASRVRPGELWFSLLTQLREGLLGRLHTLRVPLRNDLLTWPEARGHVLRLASVLGRERGQDFVIAIDGIDHAARAAQTMPDQSADFFRSLPGPDELWGKSIRLLLAGQPAGAYSAHYPAWLTRPHPGVRLIELTGIREEDVRAIYLASTPAIPPDQADAAVRVIHDAAKGNTLSTVFAVAEAGLAATVDDLAVRLKERRLADGVIEYYNSIWAHAIRSADRLDQSVDACLTGALSVARRGVTPAFLAAAFADLAMPADWWEAILESLGPLLTLSHDGYRVRHNDLRVFLAGRYASLSPPRRRGVASRLVDYLQRPDSDRATAHVQMFDLLRLADRQIDAARVFDVGWVLEGGALGVDTEQLVRECDAAVRALPVAREWPLVVSVACGAQTLDRLIEAQEGGLTERGAASELPPFLPSEAAVKPRTQWVLADLHALVRDAQRLLDGGERARAAALVQRWLGGLSLKEIVEQIPDACSPHRSLHEEGPRIEDSAREAYRGLGRNCGQLRQVPTIDAPADGLYPQALFAFERGYVEASLEGLSGETLDDLFSDYRPGYLDNWEVAIRGLARAGRWGLVREALQTLLPMRDTLSGPLRAEATAWALRSGAAQDDSVWLAPLGEPGYGVGGSGRFTLDADEELAPYLAIAYARGWREPGTYSRDIAAALYSAFDEEGRRADTEPATRALLRASALRGRADAALARSGVEEARRFVEAGELSETLCSLWGEVATGNTRFTQRSTAAEMADALADLGITLEGPHSVAVTELAVQFAAEFPVDQRMPALWRVIDRAGRRDIQRQWLVEWLGPTGRVWPLSQDEVHTIVLSLLPRADALGEDRLRTLAVARLRSVLVGYRGHKEYSFSHLLDWFRSAATRTPELWRTHGWHLWHLCDRCDEQGGDNRLDDDVRDHVSGAALRCGVGDWWSLIVRTVGQGVGGNWHDQTRQRFVEGVALAVGAGAEFPAADLPVLWAIGLSLSYWHDEGDNVGLRSLRDALLRAAKSEADRRPLVEALGRTSRSTSLDRATAEDRGSRDDRRESPSAGAEAALEAARAGRHVPPSMAASALRAIRAARPKDEAEQVALVLGAIGTEYFAAWSYAEGNALAHLMEITRLVSGEQLWHVVEAAARKVDGLNVARIYATYPNLLDLCLAKATVCQDDELLVGGLATQIKMHGRWARVGPHQGGDWPSGPVIEDGLHWEAAAVRVLGILLASDSPEAVTAALEGAHSLVAARPEAVADLFSECKSAWQRHWVLSASESWASLHPEAMRPTRDRLEELLAAGSLAERLQAYVVLSMLSGGLGHPRPAFPPLTPVGGPPRVERGTASPLLRTPGQRLGHAAFSDTYSWLEHLLATLRACGWSFQSAEGEIAAAVAAVPRKDPSEDRGAPSRHDDCVCSDLRIEAAVGQILLTRLGGRPLAEEAAVALAQGFLASDDAWLQRAPYRRSTERDRWPSAPGFGSTSDLPAAEIQSKLAAVAEAADLGPGWRTLAARVLFCTDKTDHVLELWYEERHDLGLLTPGGYPSCPSGRTFLWFLGDFFEPGLEGTDFVSGYFVGGRQRLHHDFLQIQPPTAWRDRFGWSVSSRDPLTWLADGEPVARYERFHGPLRQTVREPRFRQPLLDRWIVTEVAFTQLEEQLGSLRRRVKFRTHPYPG